MTRQISWVWVSWDDSYGQPSILVSGVPVLSLNESRFQNCKKVETYQRKGIRRKKRPSASHLLVPVIACRVSIKQPACDSKMGLEKRRG